KAQEAGDKEIDSRAGHGNPEFLPRFFTHALEPGNPTDRVEGDVAGGDAEAPRRERVAQLVQDDTAENGQDKKQRENKRGAAQSRIREQDECGDQEERPVDENTYPEGGT